MVFEGFRGCRGFQNGSKIVPKLLPEASWPLLADGSFSSHLARCPNGCLRPERKPRTSELKAKTAELKPKTSELKPKSARSKTQEAHSNENSHLARCPNCCPRLVFSIYDLRASAQNEAPDLRAKAQDFEATLEVTPKTSKLKPKNPKLKLSGSL